MLGCNRPSLIHIKMSELGIKDKERIRELIADKLGFDTVEVLPETKLIDELGMDSLDRIELMVEMEREFDISLTDVEIEIIETVQQCFDLIGTKI